MGFYSFYTMDTDESISNQYSSRGALPVYMVNPITGESYYEDNYEGYGEFGEKKFFELMGELNGISEHDAIDVFFEDKEGNMVYPILVKNKDNYKKYIGEKPESDKEQGYFYDDDEYTSNFYEDEYEVEDEEEVEE